MGMERFFVEGGNRLYGKVEVSGAKNAALKLIAAALLSPGRTVLHNVPRIKDVGTMLAVLEGLGVRSEFNENTLSIDRKSTRLNSSHANISYAVFCLKKKQAALPLDWPPHPRV